MAMALKYLKKDGDNMDLSLNTDGSSRKKVLLASCIFMGLAHILYLKRYIQGVFYALIEILFFFLSGRLLNQIKGMVFLSTGYKSLATFRLIDGLLALSIVALFIIMYVMSVKGAIAGYEEFCIDGRTLSMHESLKGIGGRAFPFIGLTPMVVLVVFFVIVPLIFSIVTGFTSWSLPDHMPGAYKTSIDWVGFKNYKDMFFGGDKQWTSSFGSIAIWTIVWGFCSTFTCYFGGTVLAAFLYGAKLKSTPVFRAILILPYAIPAILTVSVWKNLLNQSYGAINRTLVELNIIDASSKIPWLNDDKLAKVVCILVNMWVGVPYFMLLITGQMTAISQDVYEAAKIDGANGAQTFMYITLPLVLYQTVPLIIMSFTHNINNFGAIYFLTGGNPQTPSSTVTGSGATDILVTWIYKLTMNNMFYNKAAVLAMLVFIVLAPFAIFNFMNTKSFKEGEL